MHRMVVIDDADIIARRDDRPKVVRKRKIVQHVRGKNGGWGNARMYVPQTDCLLQILMRDDRKLCEHAGPCKRGHGCGCYDTESYCDRNCACPPDCEFSQSSPIHKLLNGTPGRFQPKGWLPMSDS